MTRTILAIATALIAAAVLPSAASAGCISCEYVPEVVRGSQTSDTAKPEPRASVRERSNAAERELSARAAKRSVRREPAAEKADTAERAPAASDAKNENSSIAAISAAFDAPAATAKADPNAASKAPSSEPSSIAVASPEPAWALALSLILDGE